jgi:hypothetical protein
MASFSSLGNCECPDAVEAGFWAAGSGVSGETIFPGDPDGALAGWLVVACGLGFAASNVGFGLAPGDEVGDQSSGFPLLSETREDSERCERASKSGSPAEDDTADLPPGRADAANPESCKPVAM